jgi:hypothetical protein
MNVSIPTQFLNTNPNSKATFRPGGDAQYVSYMVQGIVNSIADENHRGEDFETYYRTLIATEASVFDFSPALQVKFARAATRVVEIELDRIAKKVLKEARKAAKVAKADLEYNLMGGHLAKKGRWTYPVAEGTNGIVYRWTKVSLDAAGEWVPATDSVIIDA